MNTQSINSPNTLENRHLSEESPDVHSCSICKLKYNRLSDLELHFQLHDMNNDFKCLLCNALFSDLEQLKLHDLRHSLEEAKEDVADIERMILPFGLKLCHVCGEKFSCDEELINHSVKHPEAVVQGNYNGDELVYGSEIVEGEILPEDDLNVSKENEDNEDEETNYQILRQEIVTDKSGRTDIRFILIDHQNEQVEECTHTIRHQVKQTANETKKILQKRVSKRNGNIVKCNNSKRSKRIKSEDDVIFIKSVDAVINMDAKSDDEVVCLEDVELNNKSRRCKQIALKRKLWNEKVYLPPAQKLKDCPTCNKSFGDMENFKKHILTHELESAEHSANYGIINKKKSSSIQKIQDGENDYPVWVEIICEICYSNFCRKKGLRKHLLNVHKLDLKKVNFYLDRVKYNTATYYTCETCKKKFYRESRLESHDCVPAIAVVCELCNQKLSSKSVLRKHLLASHKLGEIKVNSIMEQLANYNAKFYKKLDPIGEIAISSSDGRLISKSKGTKFSIFQGSRCNQCNKDIADELEEHKCSPKIEIKCEICKYNAPSKFNLKRHLVRIHKLLLNDAEKVISEFKCYNERLKLRYLIAKTKKCRFNKLICTNAKSNALSKDASSKKKLNIKLSSAVSLKTTNLKTIKDIKMHAKEMLLNKRKKLIGKKNETKKKLIKASSNGKAGFHRHSLSKKAILSNISRKREKMKRNAADGIEEVTVKESLTKSNNFSKMSVPSRLLRSSQK